MYFTCQLCCFHFVLLVAVLEWAKRFISCRWRCHNWWNMHIQYRGIARERERERDLGTCWDCPLPNPTPLHIFLFSNLEFCKQITRVSNLSLSCQIVSANLDRHLCTNIYYIFLCKTPNIFCELFYCVFFSIRVDRICILCVLLDPRILPSICIYLLLCHVWTYIFKIITFFIYSRFSLIRIKSCKICYEVGRCKHSKFR